MKLLRNICCIVFLVNAACSTYGQQNNRSVTEQCGTMQRLQLKLQRNPQLRQKFEQEREQFNKAVKEGRYQPSAANRQQNGNRTFYTIPIVFHIVLPNPAVVTDAQIQAQLDTLNRDYAGANGDSVKVPSYFRSLFGESGIQFCLAQQTPDGQPTTGIERIATATPAFGSTDGDAVKHAATGGADGWDANNYFNVWVCVFGGGLLGYATFPGDGDGNDKEQGVVIEYRSLPGGAYTGFNAGKTLSHETGHYFNLYHIWGDDNGACTGTDYVDDTPNQGNASSGCNTGIKTDNCTTGGNGIMYQNYMDYSNDDCLVMFTLQQVTRMESALFAYRSSLLDSRACVSPIQYNYDAQLKSVNQPAQRICSSSFTPVITIRNRGSQTLTSATVTAAVDNNIAATYNWTGSLAPLATADVTLPAITTSTGTHTLIMYVSNPNNNADESTTNDTLKISFQYYPPVSSIKEGFEGNLFPPEGWDIVNPDFGMTWKKVTGVAKTGNASVMMSNFEYPAVGQQDYLRLPGINIVNVDSAFFSFQVAAATFTPVATANNVWDTLEVLVSTDCGQRYSSVYKKYGSTLVTRIAYDTSYFIPAASEWRKDSINLGNYIGAGQLLIAFRNTNGYENNIYLDDVNLRTVTINPNLKSKGFLVTPNPTGGNVTVQFYPQPVDLRSIQIFTATGQKIAEINTNGQPSNYYNFDISRYAAGMYMVRAVMGNETLIKKIIKY
jgi:Pregnancy-associated plasma protein-A/Secretion system C-terminal sorting domain